MTTAYSALLLESAAEHVTTVRLNRPARANALNTELAEELASVFSALSQGTDQRCIILTGAGDRAFCAGADLKDRLGMDLVRWRAQQDAFQRAAAAIAACPIPVVAAVNGAAIGGGLELALMCDFAFAASSAQFALTEVTLGIMPGLGGTQRLPRAAGTRRARQLILSGTRFTAEQALAYGVVNEVHAPEELFAQTLIVAGRIAANAPRAVRNAKAAIGCAEERGLQDGLQRELALYHELLDTEDRQEGIAAFNEKRPPVFRGR